MQLKFNRLRERYNVEIIAPFTITVNENHYEFDCLIRVKGAKTGMIIDRVWNKIEPVAKTLLELDYGYSCFDITDENESIESYGEVLEDWGIISA